MDRSGRGRRRAERRAEHQCAEAAATTVTAAGPDASQSKISLQTESSESSYIWSAAKFAVSGEGGGRGRLRRQPAQTNLSNASKQSLTMSAVSSLKSDLEPFETALGVLRRPVRKKATAPKSAKAPAQAPPEPPNNRPHVWHPSHDRVPEEHQPPITRPGPMAKEGGAPGLDVPPDGRLCVVAFEEAFRGGQKQMDAALMRKVVDYYEDKVQNLVVMALESREKIVEKVKDAERKNGIHKNLLEHKTATEGRRNKLDKALNIVELDELREETKMLREESEEMKRKYEELEEEKKEDEDMHEVDQELIRNFEEEQKKKDEKIKKLKEDLAKKEIALAGFQPRHRLRNSASGINPADSMASTYRTDDSGLGDSSESGTSNISNVSMDRTVSSANANIHLLEMSILHSQRKYEAASQAGAKAEKYIASCDEKTQLAFKAWRASNLALTDTTENDNVELVKRLFENALFLAQGIKGDHRKDGKAWEDKCHAWLLHLADVDAKRAANANASRENSQERANMNVVEKVYSDTSFAPARLDVPCSMKPRVLSNELEAAHFYSSSTSGRSSQELPSLSTRTLSVQLDSMVEQLSSQPAARSSQEWSSKLSKSLADELAGLQSSSPIGP